ncbi:hypothetical protein ERIN107935_10035 [Erysipelothrix inopinata]|uniref:hypothetical protein n=1 Tax=Erysipelothrix inopinata TaxID=225084 RepID=UPI0039F14647
MHIYKHFNGALIEVSDQGVKTVTFDDIQFNTIGDVNNYINSEVYIYKLDKENRNSDYYSKAYLKAKNE